MAVDISITEENSKKIAKALQDRFTELGIEVKLGQAYDAMAAMAGFRNWNTMKSVLEFEAPPSEVADRNKKSELAQALWSAAFHGRESGFLSPINAELLIWASSGDKEGVHRLASELGHVIVTAVDIDVEIERWHKHFSELLKKYTGSETPFDRKKMVELATRFSDGRTYDRRAIEDFFHDWLDEELRKGIIGADKTAS